MKKKLNIVLLGILIVSLMISTASAAYVDDHAAGIGMMAHPTSSSGITACVGCHGTLGSSTTTGFCTTCHGFPTFTLRVSATPTSVTAGSATPVQFIVKNGPANGPNVTGALVSLTGSGVPAGTGGTTVLSGLTTISVNAASAGIITATATKTASYTNGITTLTAQAPAKTLTSISVTPASSTITQGQNQQFVATGTYSDSTTAVITNSVTWSSSNTTVATIGASTGLAASVSAGTTQITATLSGITSPARTLTIQAPAKTLTSISVTPASSTITQGQNQQFVATGTYSDNTTAVITNSVTWSSSNTTVATIGASTGLAASVSAGTTQIAATLSGITSPARTLTIQAPAKTLTSISVTPASSTITQGQNQQFVATGTYSDSTTAVITNSVTWSSSNTTVAAIGASTGLAASVSAGTTQIKATSGAVSGSATMTVTAPQTTGSASVTFVVTDRVTGKPIDDAKVSMDGVKKETDDNGTAIFKNVSLRTHYYTVYEEHHAKFKGSIKVTGNTQIQVKLVPLVQKKKKQVHKD